MMNETPVSFPDRINVTPAILEILTTLEDAGFETWCVGGAVRDAIRGERGADVDLATAARPEQVQELFKRTVPVGVEHGTVGVIVGKENEMYEVTTFRRDVTTDGRHAQVEFGVPIDHDLARRDFTINAIAYHPLRNEWRDPFDGKADIEARLVRAVGDPVERFCEDRLRILRAMRFSASFFYSMDPDTWEAACLEAPGTIRLSAERVREEWWKSAKADGDQQKLMELWQESGVADIWLSVEGVVVEEDPRLTTLVSTDPVLLLASWRRPVEALLRRLKASGADIARGRAIDRLPKAPKSSGEVDLRRWLSTLGKSAGDILALASPLSGTDEWWETAQRILEQGDPLARGDLAVSGNDLLDAELVESGREMGTLLNQLLDHVVVDPSLNTKDSLMALARKLRE